MQEEWRSVGSLAGLVEASNLGRVRVLPRVATCTRAGKQITQRRPGTVMSPSIAKNGYPTIAIMQGRRRKKYTVHRLVAEAFCEGYSPEQTVNHINGVKTDNRAENLEWVSLARNTQLQWDTGLADLRGDKHPSRKLSARKVRIIRRLLSIGATSNELSELAGVSPTIIYLIRDGKRWQSVLAREDAA